MSALVGNPKDRPSHNEAHTVELLKICAHFNTKIYCNSSKIKKNIVLQTTLSMIHSDELSHCTYVNFYIIKFLKRWYLKIRYRNCLIN